MWALKLLLIPILFYLALLGAIYLGQTALVFPTRFAQGALPLTGAARFTVDATDGERLHGVHIPPRRPPSSSRLLVIGFGGNAWNAEAAADYLAGVYPQADVVTFHYRGYAPSTGKPSAAALLADTLRVHDESVNRIKPQRVVAVGFSIGSGVAARLAARRSLAGLILVTPFDSLRRVAQQHYPWLPVRWLFRHEMPAAEDLRSSKVPTAILAAGRDTVIPSRRTQRLREAVPNLVYDRTVASAGHNDLYERPEFRQAMLEALQRLVPQHP
ncbi:MAG: alpha/beta fold hydrolase [Pseudomonadota bacterium]|nr:alpha/beta fold hydrolase [Pseudomonadota bacterium]